VRRIAVLDAPSNLGLRPPTATSVPGCAKAPGALRDQGLLARLGARDAGCLTPPRYDPGDWRPGDGVAHAAEISAYSRALADRIGAIIDGGEFPVILGGDCSILIGAGIAMHRLGDAVGGRIGLVFVDGHSDFRHPGNASYVGAAAGEDLALVTGRGQADLAAIESRRPYFRDIDVVVLGIRAQDEYRLDLQAAGIVTRPVPALRAEGAARSAQWARDQLVDCAGYWVHVDVDVLDPAVMPAVDAPDPGGIAFPELEILLSGLVESPHCLGVEITVFDPDYDPDGRYAAEITSAVVSGLSPVRTTTPRPDLIAARRDLATTPAASVAPEPSAPAPATDTDGSSVVPSPVAGRGGDGDGDVSSVVPSSVAGLGGDAGVSSVAPLSVAGLGGDADVSRGPGPGGAFSGPETDDVASASAGSVVLQLVASDGPAAAEPDIASSVSKAVTGDSDPESSSAESGPDDTAAALPSASEDSPASGFATQLTPPEMDQFPPGAAVLAGDLPAGSVGPSGDLPVGSTGLSDDVLAGSEGLSGALPVGSEGLSAALPAGSEGRSADLPAGSEGRSGDLPAGSEGRSGDLPAGSEGLSHDRSAENEGHSRGLPVGTARLSGDAEFVLAAALGSRTSANGAGSSSEPADRDQSVDHDSSVDHSLSVDQGLSADHDPSAGHGSSVGHGNPATLVGSERPEASGETVGEIETESVNHNGRPEQGNQGLSGERDETESREERDRHAEILGHLEDLERGDRDGATHSSDNDRDVLTGSDHDGRSDHEGHDDRLESGDDDRDSPEGAGDADFDGTEPDLARFESDIDGTETGLDQTEDDIDGTETSLDGIESDVDGIGADLDGLEEPERRTDAVIAAQGADKPSRESNDTAIRLLSRPLGSAPLLDSEPLPATRPGMLRPRPPADPPASDGFGSPAAGTGVTGGFPPGAA
jgi:arginase